MAPSSTESKKAEGAVTPYQLDKTQTLKASTALLQHVRKEAKERQAASNKKPLLGSDDGSDSDSPHTEDPPIWLNLSTKKHIVDKNRLKPGKIAVPHSINTSPSLRICLIVADPQRAVKDAIAHPDFPRPLASQIGRVIGYSKLKAKYHQFENKRQLLSEHDLFLADDRIINRLVATLGKTFYKDTAKRPIPIRIAKIEKIDGKRVKPPSPGPLPAPTPKSHSSKSTPNESPPSLASPAIIAKEITTALSCIPVTLRPGTMAAVRVGRASFTPQQLAENIAAVTDTMIQRYVSRGGWRNVKAIHIKSPTSAALPIWLASEMWAEDGDVVEDGKGGEGPGAGAEKNGEADDGEGGGVGAKSSKKKNKKKRKRAAGEAGGDEKNKKRRSQAEGDDTGPSSKALDFERREKLAQQKLTALEASA